MVTSFAIASPFNINMFRDFIEQADLVKATNTDG